MMQEKFYFIGAYIFGGLLIAIWPHFAMNWTSKTPLCSNPAVNRTSNWIIPALLLICTIIALEITGAAVSYKLIISFVFIALVASITSNSNWKFDPKLAIATLLALCIVATIPWWRRTSDSPIEISIGELVVFILVMTTVIFLITRLNTIPIRPKLQWRKLWVFLLILILALLSFSIGIFAEADAHLTAWHHWGAYIGPSELLLSGAKIFRDFPAQYGFGPTFLIASVCGNDCWDGMYFVVGVTTFTFAVLISAIAWGLLAQSSNPNHHSKSLYGSVFLLCIVTCYLWTAYPPALTSPLTTPSVSGLRFLPATILVSFLFFADGYARSHQLKIAGHILWAIGALWSPESAFYVSFVWWPYYLFIDRTEGTFLLRIVGFSKGVLRLAAIALALIVLFLIGYKLHYDTKPSLYGFLAYVINPPGPMPPDLRGVIWFFIFSVGTGLHTLWHSWSRNGDTPIFRRGFLLVLLCYGTFSYFLGRSHDNNILNLMPFVFLVLLHSFLFSTGQISNRFTSVLCAALLGWLAVFNWEVWQKNIASEQSFAFQPQQLKESFSFLNSETRRQIHERFTRYKLDSGAPPDAALGISYIDKNFREPLTVLDYSMDLESSSSSRVWSAIHGPANFPYIPSVRRQEFLKKTASSLKRSGWLMIDKNFPADEWLADFDSAYIRTRQLDFGSYYAIRFSPR